MSLPSNELNLLRELVSLPTAPFCESHVQHFVTAWAQQNGIDLQQDASGNILLTCHGTEPTPADPWVLQAHMDHPGFEVIDCHAAAVGAWFRGSVNERYFPDARVSFFPADERPVKGTVLSAEHDEETGFLRCQIRLDESIALAEGMLGMWDLPSWRKRGDTLSLRVVDDLCGVASILLTMARLKAAGSARTVHGLLTRAEEVGFVGAISASKNELMDRAWPILGIEASRAQPNARLGDGAVIRVGDAATIYNPALTATLRKVSRALAKQNDALCYTESLMPGGSTESTGLALLGYQTCAVCLPLGNYHNMGTSGIAPEQINLRDFESLVALLADLSQQSPVSSSASDLKTRLLENHKKRASLL